MIVCSKCQFENPVHHRYCQECGALLVPDVASEPWSDTSVEAGKSDRTIHRADHVEEERLIHDNMVHVQNDQDAQVTLLAVCTHLPDGLTSDSFDQVTLQYLDRANRYRLVSLLSDPPHTGLTVAKGKGIEMLVMDAQPDVPPYLEQDQNPVTQGTAPTPVQSEITVSGPNLAIPLIGNSAPSSKDSPSATVMNRSSLPSVPLGNNTDSTPTIDVPLVVEEPDASSPVPVVWTLADGTVSATAAPNIKIIQTYFDLQEQLYPSFPRLVDAWNDNGPVVVLENRGDLACLKDMVAQPNVVPPQLLHWCHEMTELWEVLSSHQCCQSLLMLENVRIDEDHILCLRRLYFDDSPEQHTLKDLGQLWATLLGADSDDFSGDNSGHRSGLACPNELKTIYQDLVSGAIADLDTLRLCLEAAADQIHQSALGAVASPPESLIVGDSPDGIMPADRQNGETDTTDDASAPDMGNFPPDGEVAPANDAPSSIIGLGDDPTIVLPMQLHTLSNAGLTNIGIQRDHNEDFFSMDTQIHTIDLPSSRVCKAKGLYVLCDGMGGHAAGEVASAAAGEILHTYFQEHWTDSLPDEKTIEDAIIAANQGIYEQNQADASEGSRRMGTTLVMLLVQDTKVAIAHVGDSRIYRFTRRQGLEQLTVDHEVGQREIARGVAPDVAYARPDAYQLTQALGPRDQDFIRPDIQFMEMNEDSLFILGSDGLTDNDLLETYCDSHIEPLISTNANLDEGAYQLIELANQVNGHDNITVLLVRVKLRPKLSMLHR